MFLDKAIFHPLYHIHFLTDFWNKENSDCENSSFHLSCCFVLKLNDLQSVNVGLFDQYFRITGECILCLKFLQFCFVLVFSRCIPVFISEMEERFSVASFS